MPRKRKPAHPSSYYKRRYRSLSKYGVLPKLSASQLAKLSPSQKGQITKAYRKFGSLAENRIENRDVHFVRVRSAKTRRSLRGRVGKRTITKTGVFIVTPRSSVNVQIRIGREGEIVETYRGRAKVIRLPVDRRDFAIDPLGALRAAVGRRKYDSLRLLIDGFPTNSGDITKVAYAYSAKLIEEAGIDESTGEQNEIIPSLEVELTRFVRIKEETDATKKRKKRRKKS